MKVEKVAIIGAGTMGNGIAHVFAQNGFRVEFIDIKEKFVDKGLESIKRNLDRQIKKEKIIEYSNNNFSLEKGIHSYYQIYESIMGNR